MPALKNNSVLELVRGIKAYLLFEAGLTRGQVPELGDAEVPKAKSQAARTDGSGDELARTKKQLEERNWQLADRERQISRLRGLLQSDGETRGVDPTNIVWIFGTGLSGSTWLASMMGDLAGYDLWDEPMVGKLFGDLYNSLGARIRHEDPYFILGGPEERRNASVRDFVAREAALRFPELGPGRLVVKEPAGSVGAPLLMEALPESRMVFLVREFRDSIASYMAAQQKGGWMYENRVEHGHLQAGYEMDEKAYTRLLRRRTNDALQHVKNAKKAYEAHAGLKTLVRYEDLRADTLGTMKRMYSDLRIEVDEEELARVVENHSWENVPDEEKGRGKFKRKATPGSWKEDLTPQQLKIVEESFSSLIEEFYG